MPMNPATLRQYARDLRQSQTDAEQKIWYHLRSRRLGGYKFRRQVPFDFYILDFYCPEKRLAVELDGGHHFTDQGTEQDCKRDQFFREPGIKTLRFDNRQVLLETEAVLAEILRVLEGL